MLSDLVKTNLANIPLDYRKYVLTNSVVSPKEPLLNQTLNNLIDDEFDIITARTNIDLGAKLFKLYSNVLESQNNPLNPKEYLFNNFISRDIANLFFINLEKEIQTTDDKKLKKDLIEIKYKWLFLNPMLEKWIIESNFSTPEIIPVKTPEEIEKIGLEFDQYNRDKTILYTREIEVLLKECYNKPRAPKIKTILNKVMIESLVNTLEEKEHLNMIIENIENRGHKHRNQILGFKKSDLFPKAEHKNLDRICDDLDICENLLTWFKTLITTPINKQKTKLSNFEAK